MIIITFITCVTEGGSSYSRPLGVEYTLFKQGFNFQHVNGPFCLLANSWVKKWALDEARDKTDFFWTLKNLRSMPLFGIDYIGIHRGLNMDIF